MTVTVKRLGEAGDTVLARLAPDVFDEPIDADRLAAYLAAPGHLMLLAFDGDLVVCGLATDASQRKSPACPIDRLAQNRQQATRNSLLSKAALLRS